MFSYQSVQTYLEDCFKELDFARTAMWEAIQNSNMAKDNIVEVKISDAQKHIKSLTVKLEEMKVQIERIKNSRHD